ncbi:hypothetical protein BJP40_18100 [Streptomyces sp. CC53]|nr:hypothetical protein BJP40_18100 [Streptomyces sp. CC53]
MRTGGRSSLLRTVVRVPRVRPPSRDTRSVSRGFAVPAGALRPSPAVPVAVAAGVLRGRHADGRIVGAGTIRPSFRGARRGGGDGRPRGLTRADRGRSYFGSRWNTDVDHA